MVIPLVIFHWLFDRYFTGDCPLPAFIKNSKTACSTHLHPNDTANLYSNPGNVSKKRTSVGMVSYPFLDYPFLMHGKSMDKVSNQFTFGGTVC